MLQFLEQTVNRTLPEGAFKETLRQAYRRRFNPLYEIEELIQDVRATTGESIEVQLVDGSIVEGLPDGTLRPVSKYVDKARLPKLAKWVEYSIFLQILAEEFVHDIYKVESSRRGEVIIDVGAHIGTFTLRAAQFVGDSGQVIALEPSSDNFRFLCKNIAANRLHNVLALPIAAASDQGTRTLHLSELSGSHTLRDNCGHLHGLDRSEEVLVDTLDHIVETHGMKRVDMVKMDVEGGELDVLRGMTGVLEALNPRLAIAAYHRVGRCTTSAAVINFIRQYGYSAVEKDGIVHGVRKQQQGRNPCA